jgi:hypothetical protein
VFHWVDVVRVGSDVAYELQKISSGGETHVPETVGSV